MYATKTTLITLTLLLGCAFGTQAQEKGSFSKKLGAGLQIGQYQNDFGIGLNLTSPYVLDKRVAIRLRGNLMWNEHLNGESEVTWSPYSNLSLGVVGVAGEIGSFARLYAEGGLIFLFPSDDFSSENSVSGGYGLFGFEFFMNKHSNYFIEMGGIGTGAKADKVPTKPIYSNGLLLSTGFRFQF